MKGMNKKKEKIVLFGGSGFVGKNFAEELHEKYEIIVIDRKVATLFFEQIGVRTIEKNILEESCSEILLEIAPDYIVNFICIVDGTSDMNMVKPMIDVDLGSLMQIYKCTKDLKSLKAVIQFGSIEEYGNIEYPFDELQREVPMSPYAIAKQLTTNISMMLFKNQAYPIMVVRPSNLFGKYQSSQKLIPYIIESIRANKPLYLTGCEQKRDFLSVKKFIERIDCLLNCYPQAIGQIINVAGGESIDLKKIVNYTAEFFGYSEKIRYGALPYKKNEIMNLSCKINLYHKITKTNTHFSFWEDYKNYLESQK